MFLYLIIYSLIAYGVTVIVVTGDIFSDLRDWIGNKSKFIHNIFSCSLCFSTWLGFLMSGVLQLTDHTTPSNIAFNFPFFIDIFLDGMFTASIVWILYKITDKW